MAIALKPLPDDIDALKSLVAEQAVRNEHLFAENQRYKTQVLTLTEQLNLALARRYAASSEKLSPDQVSLFDEAESARAIYYSPLDGPSSTIWAISCRIALASSRFPFSQRLEASFLKALSCS